MATTSGAGLELNATSNYTAEEIEDKLDDNGKPFAKVVTVYLTLVALLNLLINPLMLLALRRVTSIEKTTKIFLSFLTLSDICNSLLMFVRLSELYAGTWVLGEFMCVVRGVVLYVFYALAILTLLLLTVDRYIAITNPLRYPTIMTPSRAKIMVCGTCAASVIVCTLMFGIFDPFVVRPLGSVYLCRWGISDWRNYFGFMVLIVVSAAIIILYVHISMIARRHARRIAATRQAGGAQDGQGVNTRAATTILLIMATLVVTWISIPIVFIVADQGNLHDADERSWYTFSSALMLSNGWMNVLIYYLRNKDLRLALQDLLKDWFRGLRFHGNVT